VVGESEGRGMSISAETVRFDEDMVWVGLSDGRVLGVPLAWFPRLMKASPAAREAVEITPFGLHWAALDEDISIEGLLAGRGGGSARWRDGEWWVSDLPYCYARSFLTSSTGSASSCFILASILLLSLRS